MGKQIKISELLNPKKFSKYAKELSHYFEQGGTWQELLGFDAATMEWQYIKAYDFYTNGDYQKAAASFSYLTTLNPYEYNYWMGLGSAKQANQFYEEAVVSYTVAEALEPETPIPYLNLAQCYYALQQKEQALAYVKKCIEVAQNRPEFAEIRETAEALLQNWSQL